MIYTTTHNHLSVDDIVDLENIFNSLLQIKAPNNSSRENSANIYAKDNTYLRDSNNGKENLIMAKVVDALFLFVLSMVTQIIYQTNVGRNLNEQLKSNLVITNSTPTVTISIAKYERLLWESATNSSHIYSFSSFFLYSKIQEPMLIPQVIVAFL